MVLSRLDSKISGDPLFSSFRRGYGLKGQITFNNSGSYNIKLTITDDGELTDTATDTIIVSEPIVITKPVVKQPPINEQFPVTDQPTVV